jgi:hypothetical protein
MLAPNLGFRIFGTLMGSMSFVELFVVEAFHEDFRMIFSLPMFIDPHATFVMLSLCYTQHPSYLFCTMLLSCILQHYVEFDMNIP